MHCTEASHIDTFTQHIIMSLACKGSSEIQYFECSEAVKICDKIMFVCYLRLPHIM